MLELLLCSLVTVFPDFLYRRYVQGKRLGREITLFSVWFELRWGITACLLLTITLITIIFYYHPSTANAVMFFRTQTILPETPGRVSEVYVTNGQHVAAGEVLFRMDDGAQRAAVVTAEQGLAEVDAAFAVAEFELAEAAGRVQEARGAIEEARYELALKREVNARNPDVVSAREIRRLENLVLAREGRLDAAIAARRAVETELAELLPARRATALATVEQAEVELEKTVVSALSAGRIEQFALQPGDYVSSLLRPAGILIPDELDRGIIEAGFDQLSAQVITPGMVAEVACFSRPFTIVPMVVADVQEVIPAGQFRPSDRLVDVQRRAEPGTVTVFLAPLWDGGTAAIPPGSKCLANAYTSNHDRLDDPDLGMAQWAFLHMVDTVGIVHAALLRIQALFLPVRELVFAGH
ncbi:MAG: biotin/lipoyl-binding protein [Alphaproteobacteria bacterium]|jgi:multidrug resistance efflux pump|nr:biotin/lipoyl-binding protein [Alphaproteobacteria bacterium]